ncbi:WD40 repeat domain-containing protein [Streptomyces ossamyceticus]|uniref:WD40 repeat domain-containing protein n=1 Tax=Streptomyces ossamyceticus TaxID=249581 RepID=UPI0006E24627|nr:WD40 repeat domain-containing protein [Streptomyces ossamyceticus]
MRERLRWGLGRGRGLPWGRSRPHSLIAEGTGSIVAGGNIGHATVYIGTGGENITAQDLRARAGHERIERERASAERQREAFARHFLPKARASVRTDGVTWDFTGRREALRRIVTWLTDPAGNRPGLVVSGAPGSGKTAVLGLIASLSDPSRHSHVPKERVGVDAETLPPPDSFNTVIYAAGLSAEVISDALAHATRRAGTSTPVVLIDAVDEAVEPKLLVDSVLKPLLLDGSARLLLGMRTEPAAQVADLCDEVDLDGGFADPEGMRRHVEHVLRQTTEASPFRRVSAETVSQVAEGIAHVAGPSFLVGRLLAQMLAGRTEPPDLRPDWEAELPRLPGEILERDLTERFTREHHRRIRQEQADQLDQEQAEQLARDQAERLGREQAERALDLLRPLAFAEGNGLPDEDIWAGLAGRMAGRRYDHDDVLWLREHVGSYAVRSTDQGHTVYQPHHLSLAEHLRAVSDPQAVHRCFVDYLVDHTPVHADGTRDWRRASFYTHAYLATHIAKAGGHEVLDELMLDPAYLLGAIPYRLLGALDGHRLSADRDVSEVRSAINAYRQAAADFRRTAPELRPAALDLAVRTHDARTLQARMSPVPEASPWKARWVDMRPRRSGYTLTKLSGEVTRMSAFRYGGEQYLAVVSDAGEIEVWNVDADRPVISGTIAGGKHITGLDTVVGNGHVYLATSSATRVQLWDVFGGDRALGGWTVGHPASDSETSAVTFAEVAGELRLFCMTDEGLLHRFDVLGATQLPSLPMNGACDFMRSNATVVVTPVGGRPRAVVSAWNGVQLIDLETGLSENCSGGSGYARGIQVIPGTDPPQFLVGKDNHTVYRVRPDGAPRQLRTSPESVRDVDVWTRGGDTFAIAGHDYCDQPLELFSLTRPGLSVSDFYDARSAVSQVRVMELRHGHVVIAAGQRSGAVRIWDFPEVPE